MHLVVIKEVIETCLCAYFVQIINIYRLILRTLHYHVEIKCQLAATEVFIADLIACSTCFGHHYAHHQELKSIIRWLLPVVFRAVVFKLLVWCGAEGYVSGLQDGVELRVMCPVCRMLQHPANRTHNLQLHTRPAT